MKQASTQNKPRGFTLVELMVALTGSLFFVIFVFMLSRDASRFFQSQIQISDTTVSVVNGFERLRADIARAGFLASPNLARDINHCPRPQLGSPQAPARYGSYLGLQQMGLARIIQAPYAGSNHMMVHNSAGGIDPDKLVLYGNYTTADEFAVRSASWGSDQINLEPTSNALVRIGYDGNPAVGVLTEKQDLLKTIFRSGSLLRIADETGREQYSIIDTVTINTTLSPNVPVIKLKDIAVVTKDSADGATCGLRAHSAGITVNPVDIIRYEIADVRSNKASYPHLDYLFNGAAPDYDDTRLDLMRYRLPPNIDTNTSTASLGAAVLRDAELIAEYAVDLKFGVTALTNTNTGVLTYFGEDDVALANYAGVPFSAPANGANLGPHLIRGIHARLSVRTRSADFDGPLLADPDAVASEQLFRVELAEPALPSEPYGPHATLRSLRSHIATRNAGNARWN